MSSYFIRSVMIFVRITTCFSLKLLSSNRLSSLGKVSDDINCLQLLAEIKYCLMVTITSRC